MLVEETTRERAENDAPILVPVHELTLPEGRICRLYVGNLTGAQDGAALLAAGITSSLNVSLNIDVPPLELPDGTHMRRAKVGLIDGLGNTPAHLAAAVLALEGLVTQASPGKPNYPAHRAGHVLVNCRGGRSRSVIVLAIYLHLRAAGPSRRLRARSRISARRAAIPRPIRCRPCWIWRRRCWPAAGCRPLLRG
ncbi:protein-tyrosine phosphatase family protein [Paracoccus cavernae]|uniref:protein phosphatase n=1 Tax=Paracoccus cavernae TaxID=1571207 RepID=UPI003630816A